MTVSKVDTDGLVPLKIWTANLEAGALEQAKHLTQLPFAFKHVAVMPDGHQGYGMPIGGVLATTNVIVPYAVGVDIGCGVRAWNTGIKVKQFKSKRAAIMKAIQKAIPVGFGKHPKEQPVSWADGLDIPDTGTIPVVNREFGNSMFQLGTLGGGNHFIEVQADDKDNVWVMIHSGSRNLGKQVCDHYNDIAVNLNSKWHTAVPKEWQLAFLPIDSAEGMCYIEEMKMCLKFAKANREHMMQAVDLAFNDNGLDTDKLLFIDVHHNYVAIENHFDRNVWVHRKGAVKAVGDVLIPGSMGSVSYVGKGLGSPESFKSCSHGAGRAMGRKAAIRDIKKDDVLKEMKKKDVALYVDDDSGVAAESRQSYHDIDVVMKNQSDLVEIVTKLRPLAVLKDVK